MEIRRDFYLDKLIKRKNNGLIKVITGIRRCGKSYLLNNLFYHHLLESGVDADHIIRFAFDSADDLYLIGESLIQIEKEKRGVDPEKFMAYIRSKVVGEEMYYLLLDEIQMLDCFEAVLNGYLRKDNMDVFVTGSNAKLLSKDIATEFAGRGDEVHMYPLSFAEFMTIYSGDKYMGLSEYMLYGGIPLVVLREGANDKAVSLQNLFNEISSRYYIQSAYSLPDEAKRTQEIRPFRKIDDSFKKIVITKDIVQPYYDDYGILTVNIYDFLLDPQILEK